MSNLIPLHPHMPTIIKQHTLIGTLQLYVVNNNYYVAYYQRPNSTAKLFKYHFPTFEQADQYFNSIVNPKLTSSA